MVLHYGEYGMSDTEMQIFNDLHVIRRNNQANIAQMLHLPTLESAESNRHGPTFSRYGQRLENIRGISAATYRERDISRLQEILQLLREDVLVAGVVSPSRNGRDIVSESYGAKTVAIAERIARSFAEITGEM